MKLDYLQALKRVHEARGAWVMQGQEPLLEQNLLDALRRHWQSQEIERQRYEIQSVQDWKNVFNALNSLSLFSQQLAIEAHGNIKPDAAGLKLLKEYLQYNEQNLLVVVMPKQDTQSLKSSFFQTIEANGVLVSLQANYPQDRQRILTTEADKLGITLNQDAWQWLLEHHEHNLLAAKNSPAAPSRSTKKSSCFAERKCSILIGSTRGGAGWPFFKTLRVLSQLMHAK